MLSGDQSKANINVLLMLAAITVGIVALFWSTAVSMAAVWNGSETYRHGWLVAPAAAWLAWRERQRFDPALVRPWWPALLLIVLAGFAWLLGRLASVSAVQHFGLAGLVQAAIAGALGPVLARRFWFPILFLVFAVPFGEWLVPTMMDHTADFVVATLHLTNIPVYREGNFLVLPSGNWSVIEACSGIRYLIVSIMAGTLYAYLTYRSVHRRLLFVLAAFVTPIIANWLRASTVVLVGHLSDNRIAVGFDHLIYGAIFFGVVIGLLFWVGSFWREDTLADLPAQAPSRDWNAKEHRSLLAFLAAAAATAAVWPALANWYMHNVRAGEVALSQLTPADGWQAGVSGLPQWAPVFKGARTTTHQSYRKDDARAEVYIAYYRGQAHGRELISSENTIVTTSDPLWRQLFRRSTRLEWTGRPFDASGTGVIAGREKLLIAKWYWIDGQLTGSDIMAKLLLVKQMLSGRGDDGAAIVVWTDYDEGSSRAAETIAAFTRSVSPGLDARLREIQDGR